MTFNSPQEVLGALVHAYYDERSIEATLACVTDDIEWVGTENNDSAKGKENLKKLLEADIEAFPDAFGVELDEPHVQSYGDSVVLITVTGKQLEVPSIVCGFQIRGTACCIRTENGWLISNVHTSVPNSEIEKISLQSALNEEREKQQTLLDNVPGGVAMYRVKKDGRIATDYVSDGLARICGYDDGKDIMRVMEHDSRKLVLPEDFPTVGAACKASLEKGIPTSVNYRIYGKDGNPVRITLDSVVMKNVELGEDDVAVFYAVQSLVNDETIRIIEDQKQMSELLDQMPGGLGLFELTEKGVYTYYMNNGFFDLLGTKRENRKQYSGANTLGSAHSDDLPRINAELKKLLDGESKTQIEYRINKNGEEWIWIHANATVLKREKDSARLCIAFYECTEGKIQQLQLLQNQKAVELAQQRGNLAIWTYNIDKKTIIQQTEMSADGHMGYPAFIPNVPWCFIETNSVHPDDVEKFLKAYQKLEDGAQKVDEIYRLKDKHTGKFDWIHMYYQRMESNLDADRMAVGFSLMVNIQQEAIERYQMEQKLREQMYVDAVMYAEYNLTDSLYEGENNLSQDYLSHDWENKSEEIYRKNMSTVIDAQYLDSMVEKMYAGNLLKAFAGGETKVSCEYRSVERPGMPSLWYRATAVMVQRPDTGDVMAFTYVEEIDEEKNHQIAIESSMSDGIESVAIIRLADGQARLIRANSTSIPKEYLHTFTYDDNFVDRSHKAVIPEENEFSYYAALLSTVTKELKSQEIYQYSVSMKTKDGTLKRQLFRFRYLDDRKTSVVMSISDITGVYLEEQEKKQQLETALSNVQKASQAKAEFYSRMSHDMRTPMNGILGMAELSKGETDNVKLQENIGKIQKSGEYLLSLINDTLDLQRIESGKMKLEPFIVNITDVVTNILDMVGVTAKTKGVNLKYDKGNTDLSWYVRLDALRVKQVFVNLLSNAIKFTPAGGTVEFLFELLSREGMISHDVIYVRDTGIGMSEKFLKEGIFNPFSQENNATSANYAGSGLGLSIAKSLVELMGGRIEVESELGVGTTFAVYLDFEKVPNEEAEKAFKNERKQTKDVSTQLKSKKILLAEDHPLNAEIAKKLLKKVGCDVTWVQNGQEVVQCFAEAPVHTFDAVLMDIRMPVMDGLEATRQIRALDKADAAITPIIAMTANAYEEDVRASLDAGMNAHLGKPIDPKDLYETLAANIK